MSKTVVGLFSSMQQANEVKQELVAEGYEAQSIKVVADNSDEVTGAGSEQSRYNEKDSATANPSDYTDIGSGGGTGVGEKISSFFRNLAGGDDHAHRHYANGVNSGGALLAVTVPDEEASDVAAALKQHGARDIEGGYDRAASGVSDANAYRNEAREASVAGEATSIPIIEEELVVGKHEVDRGGVRIYSHVVEQPVDADVTLRDERINIERRAVNRPATAADFAAGSGAAVEFRARGEEAVVAKTSRVVEEIIIGKESTQHTEAIHDSVRRTEVENDEIEGEPVGKPSDSQV